VYDARVMSEEVSNSTASAPAPAVRPLRVLVLDDDESVRHVIAQVLRRRNCEVIEFPDAMSCCSFVTAGKDCPSKNGPCADVLITDIKMPGIDGLEFLESLGIRKCRIPHQAVMSAFWTASALDRARRLGCRVYVKPVGLTELDRWLATLENLVDRSHSLSDHYRS
jgi:CheY-like chemotaxis protein